MNERWPAPSLHTRGNSVPENRVEFGQFGSRVAE